MSKTMEINREHFEAWLFSQPRDRVFNYFGTHPESNQPCLYCTYAKETLVGVISVDGFTIFTGAGQITLGAKLVALPLPIISCSTGFRFTAGEAQDQYKKVFPDETAPIESPTVAPIAKSVTQ